jgi:hypothetical protein
MAEGDRDRSGKEVSGEGQRRQALVPRRRLPDCKTLAVMGENKALAVARQPLELEGLTRLRRVGR